jgi:hypothetical protein
LTPRLDLYIKQRSLWKSTKWFGAGDFRPPLAFLPSLGDRDMSTLICDFESLAPVEPWGDDECDEPSAVFKVIVAGLYVCAVLVVVALIADMLTIRGPWIIALFALVFIVIVLLVVIIIGIVVCHNALKSCWIRARIAAREAAFRPSLTNVYVDERETNDAAAEGEPVGYGEREISMPLTFESFEADSGL